MYSLPKYPITFPPILFHFSEIIFCVASCLHFVYPYALETPKTTATNIINKYSNSLLNNAIKEKNNQTNGFTYNTIQNKYESAAPIDEVSCFDSNLHSLVPSFF
jgi:hypothetical protein